MSENLQHITDDLLVKYLLGEASPEEMARVRTWTETDPANRQYYEHFELIWQQTRNLSTGYAADEEVAWQKFRHRIRATPPSRSKPPSFLLRMISPPFFSVHPDPTRSLRSLPQAHWVRVAAVFLLAVAVTGILYLLPAHTAQPARTLSSLEQIITDTLPDGSIVILNKHSTLGYQWGSKDSDRTVQLQGEAFFRISPDKDRPFLVHSNGILIKVLGTSFNVHNEATKTEVIVETGLLQISNRYGKILAGPDEMIELGEKDSSLVKKPVVGALYKYYRTKEFICDNTPLWKLVETLNSAYNVHITIGRSSLRDLPLSTTFHSESLDRILAIIGETFAIRVTKNGDQIILQ